MKTVAILTILMLAALMWPQSQIPAASRAAKSQLAKPATKKLSSEQEMWCPVLGYALSGAKSFEPAMRAYLLDTAALGLGKCNAAKVRTALVDSFTATLLIPETEEEIRELSQGFASGDRPPDQALVESLFRLENKQELQKSALTHLLPIDAAKTESLLDRAEPSTSRLRKNSI
jgi:hypothetical protein